MMSALRILEFLLVAVGPAAIAQQAPRKAIRSASDLPAFSYPVTGTPARSEEAFGPIAQKLRPDIESLLRDYTIEDRPTQRGLHETLLVLDFLENRTEEARKEIAIIRDLEDKPAERLMSGLFEEALLDSGVKNPDPREFHRRLSTALNRARVSVSCSDASSTRRSPLFTRSPTSTYSFSIRPWNCGPRSTFRHGTTVPAYEIEGDTRSRLT